MDSIRVSECGQMTIPSEITKRLGMEKGSEYRFIKDNNVFLLVPTSFDSVKFMQEIMKGEAERVGWHTEEDIFEYMHDLRQRRKQKKCE